MKHDKPAEQATCVNLLPIDSDSDNSDFSSEEVNYTTDDLFREQRHSVNAATVEPRGKGRLIKNVKFNDKDKVVKL